MEADSRVRYRRLFGVSLIGAPLLMLTADAMALTSEPSMLATLVLWLSFYAFILATFWAMQIAGEGKLTLTGALFAIFGALMGGTIMGLERMRWAMGQHGIGEDLVTEVLGDPMVFFTSRAPGLTFPIGWILLALALARAGVLSRLPTAVLVVGIVLFPTGRIVVGPSANVVSDILMLAVLGWLGVRVLSGSPLEQLTVETSGQDQPAGG